MPETCQSTPTDRGGGAIGELTHDKTIGIGMVAEAKWVSQREWVEENVVGKMLGKIRKDLI